MTIIDIVVARHHLRVEPDYPEEQVLPHLQGAEELAQRFLNRRVYAVQADLDNAKQAMAGVLEAAALTRSQAFDAALAISDCAARSMLARQADEAYAEVLAEQQRVARGIVITANIKSAILLIMGHLDENRETVARGITLNDLPKGAEYFLWPHRVGLGI